MTQNVPKHYISRKNDKIFWDGHCPFILRSHPKWRRDTLPAPPLHIPPLAVSGHSTASCVLIIRPVLCLPRFEIVLDCSSGSFTQHCRENTVTNDTGACSLAASGSVGPMTRFHVVTASGLDSTRTKDGPLQYSQNCTIPILTICHFQLKSQRSYINSM